MVYLKTREIQCLLVSLFFSLEKDSFCLFRQRRTEKYSQDSSSNIRIYRLSVSITYYPVTPTHVTTCHITVVMTVIGPHLDSV